MNDLPSLQTLLETTPVALAFKPAQFAADVPAQQRVFVELRAQGTSFSRIAEQIGVSKKTLIGWSRKFQFEIQNLRAIELEQLQHELISTRTARLREFGLDLNRILQELSNRDL